MWIVDNNPPRRATDVPGLGQACGFDSRAGLCSDFGLSCVNTKPEVGFDPGGLAYCTRGCANDGDCADGYFCGEDFFAYPQDSASDTEDGACIRSQPSYAAGAAGPIYLVEPSVADVNRSDGLISSPFEEEFIEVKRGKMVVTAIRIDGFYVTDLCPELARVRRPGEAPVPPCTEKDYQIPSEFNHLFVFNFTRPDDLFAGDQLFSVSGPMSEFNGLTEMNFPLWEVDLENSPQPIPEPISLNDPIADHFPHLLPMGQPCFLPNRDLDTLVLLDCNAAMERLEAARVKVRVGLVQVIQPGSREAENLDRFGQWPVEIPRGTRPLIFQLVTRENIPFFDPRTLGGEFINEDVIGNLRQVAFDDRSDPIWIVEPRDQNDCTWCTNN